MRIPRIYHAAAIASHSQFYLAGEAAHHVGRVLRMRPGQRLLLFNGEDQVFAAHIVSLDKTGVRVAVAEGQHADCESPLNIHLGQVISRGERMDFTVQKAVELGVAAITPLFSTRCGVALPAERLAKKQAQWQKIAVAACEQCGRNRVPAVSLPRDLISWSTETGTAVKLILDPRAEQTVNSLSAPITRVRLLIGPEGGLTDAEMAALTQNGFSGIRLGQRILRTETAALTAVTALQVKFGDLG